MLRIFISTEGQKDREPCRVRVVPSKGSCYNQAEGKRLWGYVRNWACKEAGEALQAGARPPGCRCEE